MSRKKTEHDEHHEPLIAIQAEQKEPEKPIQEILEEWIEFPRVKILSEDQETYTVEYDGEKLTFSKAKMEHEIGAFYPGGGGTPTINLRQEMRQVFRPIHGLFLDDNIPSRFLEVIIFHELREMEYSSDENAHQKALHDEVLYVLKHFRPEEREQYFKFAEKAREAKSPQRSIDLEEVTTLLKELDIEIIKIPTREECDGHIHILYNGFGPFIISFDTDIIMVDLYFQTRLNDSIPQLTKKQLIQLKQKGINPEYYPHDNDNPIDDLVVGLNIVPLDNRNTRTLKNCLKKLNVKLKILTTILKSCEFKKPKE